MIVYGERALTGDGARALLNLATRLGLQRAGAGLIEVPSVPNSRGLREAGFAPGHGPGYETLAEPGRDAHGIAEGLASGELSTVWLNYTDPVRFFPDRALWEQALGTAQSVIAVESVMTETVRTHADVVFPGEAYPEKEGTVTNLDGRVQRLRVAIGRPKGRSGMPGSGVRAVWQVISEIGDLGIVTGAAASKQLFEAVPFYAGLTLDEIGGRGIRWPERVTEWQPWECDDRRRAGGGAGGRRRQAAARHLPAAVGGQGGRRLSDPAVRDPAPGGRALARGRVGARRARGRPRRGGATNGTRIAGTAKLRAAVPAGSVFVAEGVHDAPANLLNEPLVEVRQP